MHKQFRLILIGLTAAALVTGVALAQGPAAPGRGPAGQAGLGRAKKVVQQLGLSKEQVAQIRGLIRGAKEERARCAKEVRAARLRLELALTEGAEEKNLAASLKDYRAAVNIRRQNEQELMGKAFAVLTTVQQAKAVVLAGDGWWQAVALRIQQG